MRRTDFTANHENHVILNEVKNLIAFQRNIQRGSAATLNMTMSVDATTA
jgi:hypothetical protein